jgi:hypothetical protein
MYQEYSQERPLEHVLDEMSPDFGPRKKMSLGFRPLKNVPQIKCPW